MAIAAVYRWRVKPGMEAEFEDAWRSGTRAIHDRCGSFGARLHRAEDGSYVSYALWPSEEARQSCMAEHDFSDAGMDRMQAAVETRFETEILEVTADALDALPPS